MDETTEPQGLYKKYTVLDSDGNTVEGFTFVLKEGDPAALAALRTYADTTENHALANNLYMWLHDRASVEVEMPRLAALWAQYVLDRALKDRTYIRPETNEYLTQARDALGAALEVK